MPAHTATATALANAYTADEVRGFLRHALEVKMGSVAGSQSFEGSNFTIDRTNCEQVISDCNEALEILAALVAEEDREAIRPSALTVVDFSHRPTQ